MEEFVAVFRSADESARDDATAIADLLTDEGISATLLDDDAPGVPEGVWEVRVSAADAPRAEQLIASRPVAEDEFQNPDHSHNLDLVPVFHSADGTEDESEALTIKSLLEANGVYAVVVGKSVPIPSLGWEVRVAREHEQEAARLISEARAAGPAAADEAEADTEK